ncbi:MAG: SUMF1/EgtB/PvdO family nonheme iron enzyme [Polyangiaceae bacterium]|nr:SUMF1/EgtB/PvdO family nonheme iron enzyme [Polyangiaceae bacterium]
MRPALLLALALLTAASAGDAAAPTRPRGVGSRHPAPSLPAAREAEPSAGIVALRAPGPDMILVRGGAFTMGSTDVEIAHALTLCKLEPGGEACADDMADPNDIADVFKAEAPAHEVHLSDYWIDRTEVTVARYRRCVSAGACDEPPYASGGRRFDHPDLPVVLVTWNDAVRFCAWAGGRLPTEAEWERAARGAGGPAPAASAQLGRRYPWGHIYNPFHSNHGRLAFDAFDDGDGFLELAPAGSFPAGRTPDGIDDLAGNVEEWVADYFGEYPAGNAKDPLGPTMGEERVVRGGSYTHARPWLRGAARSRDVPSSRRAWRGFRCARSAR